MWPSVNWHSSGKFLEVPSLLKCFASSPNSVKYVESGNYLNACPPGKPCLSPGMSQDPSECSSVKMMTRFFQRKREWSSGRAYQKYT